MRRRNVLLLLVLILPAVSTGYSWHARYASAGMGFDHAQAIATDPAGNAYVTGYVTVADSGRQFVTVKYGPTGTLLWQHRYGGTGDDAAVAIAFDAVTASVYVTGHYSGTNLDFLTIKYNSATGDTIWTRRYDGPASGEDRPAALAVDNLGYACVAGYARVGSVNQAVVVKYSPAGLQSWATLLPSTKGDLSSTAAAVGISPTRSVYVCGSTRDSHGACDILVARITEGGSIDWEHAVEGSGLGDDIGTAVSVDDSGNVAACGAGWTSAALDDYLVVKYAADGSLRWSRTYDGPIDDEDWPTAIATDPSYHVYVTGNSIGNGNDEDYLTIRYDKGGTQLWAARYSGQGNNQDSATAIAVRGSRVYVTGFTYRGANPEIATVGYDTAGTQLWASHYYNSPPTDDEAFAIATVSDGVFYVAGESYDDASSYDMVTLKYAERDFGVVSIDYPNGTLPPRPLAPEATIRNCGVKTETTAVYLRIYQGATLIYQDMQYAYDVGPDAERTVVFKNFTGDIGSYVIRCSTAFWNDLYRQNDTAGGAFTFVWTTPPAWVQSTNVPPGPAAKAVKDGGALCYGRGADGNASVFAFKGNGTNEFYRFNTDDSLWTSLESIGIYGTRRKAVKKGAALAYDRYDSLVFALKGNNTLEFWQYYIPGDTWVALETLPMVGSSIRPKRVKGGSGLAFLHHNPTDQSYVFATKGNKSTEFYAYNVAGRTWTPKRSVPTGLSGRGLGDGSCLVNAGGDIYAFKGNYHELYQYDWDLDTWYTKEPLPMIGAAARKRKAKIGTAMAFSNHAIYCIKGGSTEFWAYYTDADTWVELESMPRVPSTKVVKGGGALTSGGGYIWALKGNKTFEFWSYYPGSDADGAVSLRRDGVTGSALGARTSAFSIAPNPLRTGFATLSFGSLVYAPFSLSIYDALGRLALTVPLGQLTAGARPVDLRSLSAGIYLAKLSSGTYTATQKLIIEK
jgi:hypothetical protein